MSSRTTRRKFLVSSAVSVGAFTYGLPTPAQVTATTSTAPAATSSQTDKPKPPPLPVTPAYDRQTINLVGPKPGYSPMIGVLVSQLTWMEPSLIGPTRKLNVADLDYLLDSRANTIGALMLHTAAAEVFYQRNTFSGEAWGKFPKDVTDRWSAAMQLGDLGRSSIKGHDWAYYADMIRTVRQRTLDELAKRDDAWLLTVDKDWPWGPQTTSASGFT